MLLAEIKPRSSSRENEQETQVMPNHELELAVDHWVELIEEDLQSESRPSLQLIESRRSGIHSIFENLSKATDNPVEMYNAFSSWIFGKVHDLS